MSDVTIPAAKPRRTRLQRNAAPVEDKSATPDGDMHSINRANAEMTRLSRMERMRQYFAEQPRETIKIRKELGEQTPIINGYPFQIQAGEKVSVPVDVANLLRDADII